MFSGGWMRRQMRSERRRRQQTLRMQRGRGKMQQGRRRGAQRDDKALEPFQQVLKHRPNLTEAAWANPPRAIEPSLHSAVAAWRRLGSS